MARSQPAIRLKFGVSALEKILSSLQAPMGFPLPASFLVPSSKIILGTRLLYISSRHVLFQVRLFCLESAITSFGDPTSLCCI